jgi:competence protein ComEC
MMTRRCDHLSFRLTAVVVVLIALFGAGSCATDNARDDHREHRGARSRERIPSTPRETADDKDGGVPARSTALDPQRTMSIHLLDVGQGAATLLEFPCGAVLVDTGGELDESFDSRAALKEQLDAFFKRRTDLNRTLDGLIITHPHIDHLRGIPGLLQDVTVKNVVDNGDRGDDDLVRAELAALRGYIDTHMVGHRSVRTGEIVKRSGMTDEIIDPIACKDVDPTLRVLWGGVDEDPGWGTDNYGKPRFANQNNHSVVLRVDFGEASVLITGDLEDVAIRGLMTRYEGTRWLDVDIYQAGHHGSANGTTRELVDATSPALALIAMGDPIRQHSWTAWAYGHPRAVTVNLLNDSVTLGRPPMEVLVAKGVKRFTSRTVDRAIFGTGWDGAVAVDVTTDGEISVRRSQRRR